MELMYKFKKLSTNNINKTFDAHIIENIIFGIEYLHSQTLFIT